jgi:hypothetical protein
VGANYTTVENGKKAPKYPRYFSNPSSIIDSVDLPPPLTCVIVPFGRPLLFVGTDMTLYSLYTEAELELLNALRAGLISGDTIPAGGEGGEDESE